MLFNWVIINFAISGLHSYAQRIHFAGHWALDFLKSNNVCVDALGMSNRLPTHEKPVAVADPKQFCAACGRDREGAMFGCPHCGAGSTGIKMVMNEDEIREYQMAKQNCQAESHESLLMTLACILIPPLRWIR